MDKEAYSEVLRNLHESLLEPEPDFKTMSHVDVSRYLKENEIDAGKIFQQTQNKLEMLASRGYKIHMQIESP